MLFILINAWSGTRASMNLKFVIKILLNKFSTSLKHIIHSFHLRRTERERERERERENVHVSLCVFVCMCMYTCVRML